MATNRNAPRGFVPIKNRGGTIPRIGTYTVAAATTVYQGNLLAINASGLLITGSHTLCITGQIIGAAAGYATAAQECKVYDDPEQLFELQADDNTVTTVAAAVGALYRLVLTTGNTTTLQSKHQIDASTGAAVTGSGATTVTPIRIEGLVPTIGNSITSSYSRWAVRIIPGVHHYGSSTVGVLGTRFRGV